MNDLLEFWKNVDTNIIIEIGLTLVLIILFFIVRKIVSKLIKNHATKLMHSKSRVTYVVKLANFGLILCFITLIAIVWEISFRGLSVYFASFFTIVGVAFFASWSILSNVTAYAILFFYFPFKIGSKIKIIDGDNSVEGKVDDITIFFISIKLASGEKVTYPNNVALQKAIMELPK
jgi:small-conductance mechanosensitive channel